MSREMIDALADSDNLGAVVLFTGVQAADAS